MSKIEIQKLDLKNILGKKKLVNYKKIEKLNKNFENHIRKKNIKS